MLSNVRLGHSAGPGLKVIDDLPKPVPISDAELVVLESYFSYVIEVLLEDKATEYNIG